MRHTPHRPDVHDVQAAGVRPRACGQPGRLKRQARRRTCQKHGVTSRQRLRRCAVTRRLLRGGAARGARLSTGAHPAWGLPGRALRRRCAPPWPSLTPGRLRSPRTRHAPPRVRLAQDPRLTRVAIFLASESFLAEHNSEVRQIRVGLHTFPPKTGPDPRGGRSTGC